MSQSFPTTAHPDQPAAASQPPLILPDKLAAPCAHAMVEIRNTGKTHSNPSLTARTRMTFPLCTVRQCTAWKYCDNHSNESAKMGNRPSAKPCFFLHCTTIPSYADTAPT